MDVRNEPLCRQIAIMYRWPQNFPLCVEPGIGQTGCCDGYQIKAKRGCSFFRGPKMFSGTQPPSFVRHLQLDTENKTEHIAACGKPLT